MSGLPAFPAAAAVAASDDLDAMCITMPACSIYTSLLPDSLMSLLPLLPHTCTFRPQDDISPDDEAALAAFMSPAALDGSGAAAQKTLADAIMARLQQQPGAAAAAAAQQQDFG